MLEVEKVWAVGPTLIYCWDDIDCYDFNICYCDEPPKYLLNTGFWLLLFIYKLVVELLIFCLFCIIVPLIYCLLVVPTCKIYEFLY
jgi:hypothetical protein